MAVRNAVTALAYVLIGILAAVSLFIISNTTACSRLTKVTEPDSEPTLSRARTCSIRARI